MKRKYEITDTQHPDNSKLFQIRAARDIPSMWIKAGDLGGYIEHEGNLSQEGDCWIGCDYSYNTVKANMQHPAGWEGWRARVFGNARVLGNAQLFGDTCVSGYACVSDYACIYGTSEVSGFAVVTGNAQVFENARVTGTPQIYGYAQIYGNAQIYGTPHICGYAHILGKVRISGNTHIVGTETIVLDENMNISGGVCISSSRQIYYSEGITAYFNSKLELIIMGTSLDIEQHKTLARLKLS